MQKDTFFLFAISWIITLLFGACSPALTATPTATITFTTTPSPVPTETPIPTATKIVLNVSSDVQKALEEQKALNADGSISDTLAHSDGITNVTVFPESIKVLPSNNTATSKIIVGQEGDNQRYIWNIEIISWVPEFQFSWDYESSRFVELSAVYDGSLKLSSFLYFSEHPDIIPETAAEPHYMFNMGKSNVSISPMRYNQHQWPQDPNELTLITDATIEQSRTWGWMGTVVTMDDQGNEIMLFPQVWLNPTTTNDRNILPLFFGVSIDVYDRHANAIGTDGLNHWERMMQTNSQQLLIAFPYPASFLEEPQAAGFRYSTNSSMPTVGKLLQGRDFYSIFSPDVLARLEATRAAFDAAPNKFSSPDTPFFAPTGTLPDALSDMVVFPGIDDLIK